MAGVKRIAQKAIGVVNDKVFGGDPVGGLPAPRPAAAAVTSALPAFKMPSILGATAAPTNQGYALGQGDVGRQLEALRARRGRGATNLTRRKKKKLDDTLLEDGGSSAPEPTTYVNPTLG